MATGIARGPVHLGGNLDVDVMMRLETTHHLLLDQMHHDVLQRMTKGAPTRQFEWAGMKYRWQANENPQEPDGLLS